jgi:hypothetical protein
VLHLGPIIGFGVGIRLVLRCGGGRVAKMGQCLGEISRHQEVNFLSLVVPFNGKSAIAFPFPIARAFIILLD